ncbi:MAG TPA: alpha-L-fucosidase [Paludibaculum sp.]
MITRRTWCSALGAGLAVNTQQPAAAPQPGDSTREQRLRWWHDAKFGMFIHWGLYSVLGRREWVLEQEAIPISEYEQLARRFTPQPGAARQWARLAKRAGQKYMVLTTKHHEGFCLFDTKLTDYCAPRQACGRDLVREYVEAARAEGLRVGFYYSLMDWHHPDGERCAKDEGARKRFVAYIHGQVRELLTNYGKIDILWYDVAHPLDAAGWESERMNRMVFELQPEIIVNNRNKLAGDFGTPEQHITEEPRPWESCMTLNGSWGYCRTDDEWKTARTVIRNLGNCARGGGNYLLNIGPRGDGSVPEPSVQILNSVGNWLERNGKSIYGTERARVRYSEMTGFTRRGNTLYLQVHFWDGATLSIPGLETKVLSARLLATGEKLTYQQDQYRLLFTGLPATPPDEPVTVIELECEGEPVQMDRLLVRGRNHRGKV